MSDDEILKPLEAQFACSHDGEPCQQTRLSMDMDNDGRVVIVAHGSAQDLVKMTALMVAHFMGQLGVPRIIVARSILSAKLPKD